MARIVYSALIDNIRGSIGGTTFQRNAYGYTVKHKPNMVKPWTADQKFMQICFTRAVKAWKEAADATRANWETWATTNPQYAKHNPSSVLSGFACFTKWHMFEFMGNGSVDTAPQLTIPAAPPITIKIILAAGVLTLDITVTGGQEDWDIYFFLSQPFGTAQNFIGTKTRYIAKLTDLTGATVITASYPTKWGSLPVLGDRIAVDYVRSMESGGEVRSRIQEIVTVTAS
jgi:hypothetical protein